MDTFTHTTLVCRAKLAKEIDQFNADSHFCDTASTIEGLDLWIHTGDYIYEVGLHPDRHCTDSFSIPFQTVRRMANVGP